MENTNGITTSIETITPMDAAAILDTNIEGNRNVSEQKVKEYVSALVHGEWQLNGESIKISDNGLLVDGQHRLMAIVESGIPMKTMVVRGVQAKSIVTMDTGKPRNLENVLAMRNVPNGRSVATVLRTVSRYREHGLAVAAAAGSSRGPVTITSCLKIYEENPSVIDELGKTAKRLNHACHMSTVTAALALMELRAIDRGTADRFFGLCVTGEVNFDSPIAKLRIALDATKESKKRGVNFNPRIQLALVYKAWNKWVMDEPMKQLRFTPTQEKFPVPVNLSFGA